MRFRHSFAAWPRLGAGKFASVGALFFFAASTLAISIATPDSRIPLALLLKRQAEALERRPDSFWIHRGLARTHGLAADWKLTGSDQVRAGGYYGSVVPLLWCDPCAHVDYRRPAPSADDVGKEPQEEWLRIGSASEGRISFHRQRSLHHYRRALELGTELEGLPSKPRSRRAAVSGLDVDQTELGLAWNLLQTGQAEDREEAKSRLIEVIARQEKSIGLGPNQYGDHDRGNFLMGPLASEAIDYLLPLLGQDEQDERRRLNRLHAQLGHSATAVSPLAIDLREVQSDDLVDLRRRVDFDLDGTGVRKWSWPSDGVAWLVWDPSLEGKIEDGSTLFGNHSFHLVHPDGFAALCMLDSDADGWLRGAELQGLALWQDGLPGVREADGRSDPAEMVSLEVAGIVGLACRRELVEEESGHLVLRGGVERESLSELLLLELWDLVLEPLDLASPPPGICPRAAVKERLSETVRWLG